MPSQLKRLFLKILALFLIVISVINWFLIPMAPIEDEIPLGSFQGMVVDSNQYVYIGLDCYDRVPVYDKHGKFLKNWKVTTVGGKFSMSINKKDQILITAYRHSNLLQYSKQGDLISEQYLDDYQIGEFYKSTTFLAADSNSYTFKNGSILKSDIHSNTEIIVVQRL
jgi:hypothetical protein